MRITLALVRLFALGSLVAGATAQQVATFIPEHPLQWGKEGVAGARARAVVIISADLYTNEPTWALPAAKRSAEVLRDALVAHAGLSRASIVELTGDKVHAGAVEAALQSAAKSIGAEGAIQQGVLLVFWIGHGFSDAGQQQLFTYYTQKAGARFAPTISQA